MAACGCGLGRSCAAEPEAAAPHGGLRASGLLVLEPAQAAGREVRLDTWLIALDQNGQFKLANEMRVTRALCQHKILCSVV